MYATLGIGKIVPGNHAAMLGFAEQSGERLKSQKGFKNAVFFSDEEKNEYGSLTVWETKEDYDAYIKSYSPEYIEKIMLLFTEIIVRDTYYVNKIYTSD